MISLQMIRGLLNNFFNIYKIENLIIVVSIHFDEDEVRYFEEVEFVNKYNFKLKMALMINECIQNNKEVFNQDKGLHLRLRSTFIMVNFSS